MLLFSCSYSLVLLLLLLVFLPLFLVFLGVSNCLYHSTCAAFISSGLSHNFPSLLMTTCAGSSALLLSFFLTCQNVAPLTPPPFLTSSTTLFRLVPSVSPSLLEEFWAQPRAGPFPIPNFEGIGILQASQDILIAFSAHLITWRPHSPGSA